MGKIIALLVLLASSGIFGQETYVRPGLISTSLTISPSSMLNRSDNNYYLTGFLEGRVDKHLSFRGETHFFMDGEKEIPYFKRAARTYFGIQCHLPVKNFDPYIGFMPGVALLQLNTDRIGGEQQGIKAVPSVSFNLGASYYIWKYFHVFLNASYVKSTVYGFEETSGKSDELIFSAGLGLNINAKK